MASIAHVEDDFEIIERPDHQVLCGDPYCQLSHVISSVERASERAIEPVLEVMQKTAESLELKGPIFHARLGLTCVYTEFVKALPLEYRRIMNCNNCKRFLRLHGDLCIVGDDGALVPLMWPIDTDDVPPYYQQSIMNVLKLFEGKVIGDEFKVPKERILGTPTTGEWNHMSLNLKKATTTPLNSSMDSQDTNTSYQMLNRVIEDNTPEVIARVHHLLHEDQLPYASSHKASIKFLQKTVERLSAQNLKNPVLRTNLITRYAREAFPGCLSSLRGGMLGYLFECVNEGQDFETLKRNWQTKADPLSYLRPTAAPSVGNIESAEKIFAKLGFTQRDLERVFLTMDQVPKSAILWSPPESLPTPASAKVPESDAQKLFSHLRSTATKLSRSLSYTDAPIKDVTFRHFVNKILPTASTIHAFPDKKIQPYFFPTGKEGCKPIMNFHKEGGHTASWYTWGTASSPINAGLKEGVFTRILGIIGFPHMWDSYDFSDPSTAFDQAKFEAFTQKRNGLRFLFVLEGAREQRRNISLCLFPTLMRGEFHGVRKTVEEFSRRGAIEDPEEGKSVVGGFCVSKSQKRTDFVIGVTTKTGMVGRYRITLFE